MKLKVPTQFNNLAEWVKAARFVDIVLDQITALVNGRLTFSDNFLQQTTSVTFSAANTDTTVPHSLGFLPNGYIVVGRSANMVIYDGATANTTTNLYLRSSATGSASIIIF